MFKTIYKVALTSLIAISFLHSAQEAKANPFGDIFNNVGGRCGAVGEGRVKIYNVHRKTLFIRVEGVRPGTGYYEQELKEGQSFESSICNRDGFRVFVYTSLDCGKNHIATSEFVRVYNYEQVNITKGGFVYQHKDQFTALSRGLEFFGMMMVIKYGLASSDLAKFGLRSSNVMKMCAESDTSTYRTHLGSF